MSLAPIRSITEMLGLMSEGLEGMPQLVLAAVKPFNYYDYVMGTEFEEVGRPSSYVGYIHTDRVLAHTRKGISQA